MKSATTTKTVKPGCVRYALEVMGDKWTALLLRELCGGPKTFSELEIATVGISPRTLSQRLEMLQKEAIVHKNEYCQRPLRCKYQLTDKGSELQNILDAMADWSAKYQAD